MRKIKGLPNAEFKELFMKRNERLYKMFRECTVVLLPAYRGEERILGAGSAKTVLYL